jgi:hypothetical protein
MAKVRIRLDFSKFFKREATRNIIPSYKRLMTKGRGVENDDAPTKDKGRKSWMVDTGELRDHGFVYRATRDRLLIFGSGKKHSSKYRNPPTYKQLFQWHNKGRSAKSGETYSGIFGQLPLKSRFPDRFRDEALKQLKPQIIKAIVNA